MPYYEFISMRSLLVQITTSHRIAESIELDERAEYAVFTEQNLAFELVAPIAGPTGKGPMAMLCFEFNLGVAMLCDEKVARAVALADAKKERLQIIRISDGRAILTGSFYPHESESGRQAKQIERKARKPKLQFTPNQDGVNPELKEALDILGPK